MKNQVMVITGAASGLGAALAHNAASRGYAVVVADVQEENGQTVVKALQTKGAEAMYVHTDVSELEAFPNLHDVVMSAWGRVDVLINNAGVGAAGTLMASTEAEWDRLWQINMMGVVRGCKTFIPALKQSDSAAIVNVASFAAIALAPGVASYNVVKAGVLALSETLRCELANDGIHVSVLCPAFFKTNLTESMQESGQEIKDRINRWMENSAYTADDVAEMTMQAVERKQFLVLCDATTRWQHRMARWFPNYFYRQKVKMIKRMVQ